MYGKGQTFAEDKRARHQDWDNPRDSNDFAGPWFAVHFHRWQRVDDGVVPEVINILY